jgi:serine/threonine protein kinase
LNEGRPRRNEYKLLNLLGEGGYAQVWRAERGDSPGSFVAYKHPKQVPLARERMAREIEVQRLLDHPHVMPIVDAADNGSWFAMPLAEGKP